MRGARLAGLQHWTHVRMQSERLYIVTEWVQEREEKKWKLTLGFDYT